MSRDSIRITLNYTTGWTSSREISFHAMMSKESCTFNNLVKIKSYPLNWTRHYAKECHEFMYKYIPKKFPKLSVPLQAYNPHILNKNFLIQNSYISPWYKTISMFILKVKGQRAQQGCFSAGIDNNRHPSMSLDKNIAWSRRTVPKLFKSNPQCDELN